MKALGMKPKLDAGGNGDATKICGLVILVFEKYAFIYSIAVPSGHDVVRTFSIFSLPKMKFLSLVVVYCQVQLTNRENMSFSDVFNLTAFYLQLNLTWTAFGVMLISMSPHIGFKLAPLFSCLSGFVGGLMIPVPRMASW